MYCVYNGRVCVMVYDQERKQYVYIPEDKYYRRDKQ